MGRGGGPDGTDGGGGDSDGQQPHGFGHDGQSDRVVKGGVGGGVTTTADLGCADWIADSVSEATVVDSEVVEILSPSF